VTAVYPDDAACKKLPGSAAQRVRSFISNRDDILDEAEQIMRTAVKSMCECCPVRVPCLEQAIVTKSKGVWAATTTKERQAMRRARITTSPGVRQVGRRFQARVRDGGELIVVGFFHTDAEASKARTEFLNRKAAA
jgi:hypothetical protein